MIKLPYIPKEDRGKFDRIVEEVLEVLNRDVERQDGELNYLFTRILLSVYKPKYFNYNRAMGLLESIKQEFYRRFIASYEDSKIREHGDIR